MRKRGSTLVVLLILLPATAGTVQIYRCTATDGAPSYQDHPCKASQRQSTLSLADAPISSSPQPRPVAIAPATAATIVASAPASPPVVLPTIYACTRYDGQRRYLSDTLPAPYAVPLGALGYPGQSLDRAYSPPGGLGMSAPEQARPPRVGGPLIAGAYVEVRDRCHPASRAQVCGALRSRYDANHEQLRMAFPSDKPPLQRREDTLNAQMKGC